MPEIQLCRQTERSSQIGVAIRILEQLTICRWVIPPPPLLIKHYGIATP